MYIPAAFQATDPRQLHDLVCRHSFGTLVTGGVEPGGGYTPFATHLPFLLDAGRGPQGVLRAHMARANPQWRHFRPAQEVLVLFLGPHAFVPSGWYEEPEKMVPTWNYAAVHAYGTPRILEAEEEVLALVRDVTAFYQPGGRVLALQPPEERARELARAVVAFEVDVTRWEGKFKLSQNRSAADRRRVREALRQRGGPDDVALAEMMHALEQGPTHPGPSN
jgi:transcriptional regulator